MKEAEWLACQDPQAMLDFLHRKKSARKSRLFACACCRLVWDRIPKAWRRAVEVNEEHADGSASQEKLEEARDAALRSRGAPGTAQAPAFATQPNLTTPR